MNKIIPTLLFLCSILMFSFSGPSGFEGKITYAISIDDAKLPPEAKAMMEGNDFTMFIKGMKTRTEMSMGFQSTVSISDAEKKTHVTLMEFMGNKYMIKDPAEPADKKMPDVKVNYPGETKTIAGYSCKKADLTFKDELGKEQTISLYLTEEIPNSMSYEKRNYQFRDLKGMPLEFEVRAENGMKMRMTAKKVSKESVADSNFDIPAGYKETTMEELRTEMMKSMRQH